MDYKHDELVCGADESRNRRALKEFADRGWNDYPTPLEEFAEVMWQGQPPPVGNVNSTERGSGARANAGKPDLFQIPLFALEGLADVLTYGAKKYSPGNWATGMDWSICFAACLRHMSKWQRGIEIDEESGCRHLDLAMANLVLLSAYRDLYPEGDDRMPTIRRRVPGPHPEIPPRVVTTEVEPNCGTIEIGEEYPERRATHRPAAPGAEASYSRFGPRSGTMNAPDGSL